MSTGEAGNYIKQHIGQIIQDWIKRASNEIFASSKASELVLRSHLPDVVENLSEILCKFKVGENNRLEVLKGLKLELTREHGRSRASTEHYNVTQLAQEYAILRQVIMDQLNEKELIDVDTAEIIYRVFELITIEALQNFTNTIQEVQDRLVGTIVHDLRNPIYTAQMGLQLIRESPEDRKEALALVEKSLSWALYLISDLLDSTQIQAGRGLKLKFKEVNLSEEVKNIQQTLSQLFGREIKLEIASDNVTGSFDVRSIRRALENLIANALVHGGLKAPVVIELTNDDNYVYIEVNNQGSIITSEEQQKLFKFLNRTVAQDKETQRGWGLGLYIVKLVALGHGGEVWVESTEEKGTSFYIKLSRKAHTPEEVVSQDILKHG